MRPPCGDLGDRLNAGWTAASRARERGLAHARSHIERLLGELPAHCGIVTVLDGHPATLGWLGAVLGHQRGRSAWSTSAKPVHCRPLQALRHRRQRHRCGGASHRARPPDPPPPRFGLTFNGLRRGETRPRGHRRRRAGRAAAGLVPRPLRRGSVLFNTEREVRRIPRAQLTMLAPWSTTAASALRKSARSACRQTGRPMSAISPGSTATNWHGIRMPSEAEKQRTAPNAAD